jgi:hypothetical protein
VLGHPVQFLSNAANISAEPLGVVVAGSAAAGQVTFTSAYLNPFEPELFHVTFSRYREFVLNNVVNCPVPSKYNVALFPKVMPNCVEVVLKVGVARRSATTAAMMLVAAV